MAEKKPKPKSQKSSGPSRAGKQSAKSKVEASPPSDAPADGPSGAPDSARATETAPMTSCADPDPPKSPCCASCRHFHVLTDHKPIPPFGECRGSTPGLGHPYTIEELSVMDFSDLERQKLLGKRHGAYPVLQASEPSCGAFKPFFGAEPPSD